MHYPITLCFEISLEILVDFVLLGYPDCTGFCFPASGLLYLEGEEAPRDHQGLDPGCEVYDAFQPLIHRTHQSRRRKLSLCSVSALASVRFYFRFLCTSRARFEGSGHQQASHLAGSRSEEHTSELQSRGHLVCRLLLAKKHR